MNELVKLDTKNEEFPVNARDLHTKLGIGRDFSTWIKERIDEYGFIEGTDYSPKRGNRSDGKPGKGRNEYKLSFDMGKELAMVENNEIGRAIRKYFIAVENDWQHNKAIRLAGKEIRRELTDVLDFTGIDDEMYGHAYENVTNNIIYKLALGKTAPQIRKERGLVKSANLRDNLRPDELKTVARIEESAKVLFDLGYSYKEVKKILIERAKPLIDTKTIIINKELDGAFAFKPIPLEVEKALVKETGVDALN